MAGRTRHLLAYDIRDPRRLRRVHKVAKEFGYALQYSVFVCDLTMVELLALKTRLIAEANLSVDSIGFFDLGPAAGRGVECIEFLGQEPSPPDPTAPAIW